MNIIKQIEAALRGEYNTGKTTQQEIADRHHVKQSQIQKILSGERSVSGLSIATIEKMFPRATINLNGEPPAPALPADPFFRMVVENWPRLAPEDRGRVAGLVSGMVANQPAPEQKRYCPNPDCRAELPADWKIGVTYECPRCGQHIRYTKHGDGQHQR